MGPGGWTAHSTQLYTQAERSRQEVRAVDETRKLGSDQGVRSPSTHQNGITHLSFFPSELDTFFSSSYDHTVKIWSTESLTVAESYNLDAVVYSHDVSPIAGYKLIACATQSPLVRLVDPLKGNFSHALAGHQGAVLSVAWSPRNEKLLASGGSDGVVRLWDIRKAAASLGVLDLDDALGFQESGRPRDHGKSHAGACNGVRWSEDGEYIITVGRDEQVRVWDANTGANTLTHFGPMLKNQHSATLLPLIIPSYVSTVGQRLMIYPNGEELLMCDMLEGTLLKRLQVSGTVKAPQDLVKGRRNIHQRITALAFRASHVEIYTAHLDGFIRLWAPRTLEDVDLDEEGAREARQADNVDDRQKKRQELDQFFRDLAKRPFTLI